MEFLSLGVGGASGSGGGDDRRNNDHSNSDKGKKCGHRHTSSQIQRLEAFYKACPHPDESQRLELARQLGLEVKQIKFWFQNKRTQMKNLNERLDSNALRAENERIQFENLAMKEALKCVNCPSCGTRAYALGGGPSNNINILDQHELLLQTLVNENNLLRQEHDRVAAFLADFIGKQPMTSSEEMAAAAQAVAAGLVDPSMVAGPSTSRGGGGGPSSSLLGGDHLTLRTTVDHPMVTSDDDDDNDDDEGDTNMMMNNNNVVMTEEEEVAAVMAATAVVEVAMMKENAKGAMEEVLRLVRANEPLWVRAETEAHQEASFYVLNWEKYESIFPRAQYFNSINIRLQSSKASRVVPMEAQQLVHLFFDSEAWMNLFPTIVNKARTERVVEFGIPESCHGALHLMYEEMHIMTAMVAPRSFMFLRYCHQVDSTTWVISDVSFKPLHDRHPTHTTALRLPSGCMIQQLPNGSSKVTWVEHVGVDAQAVTHRLYRRLVASGAAYGAERWVVALERMCERRFESGEEEEGERRMKKVGEKMVRMLCGAVNMSTATAVPGSVVEVGLPESGNGRNESGIRMHVWRSRADRGQPQGVILTAVTSLWLPVPPEHLFDFLRDNDRRAQWDIMSSGAPLQELGRIPTSANPANYIAFLKPAEDNNIVIVQETFVEPLGCIVVYAPVDTPAVTAMTSEEEQVAEVPMLPSGFVVTGDSAWDCSLVNVGGGDRGNNYSGGSILTVAFQILASSNTSIRHLNMESVATVNNLVKTTVNAIKASLNC